MQDGAKIVKKARSKAVENNLEKTEREKAMWRWQEGTVLNLNLFLALRMYCAKW